jgi:hypothetical protein
VSPPAAMRSEAAWPIGVPARRPPPVRFFLLTLPGPSSVAAEPQEPKAEPIVVAVAPAQPKPEMSRRFFVGGNWKVGLSSLPGSRL